MKLSTPFIRLPYAFDTDRLSYELNQFDSSDWMEHPNNIAGNLAIPLISHGGTDNNDFAGRMAPTPHLQGCEYMQQLMANFGEVLARSRLMRLNAGAEVSPHVDFNYHWYSRVRIHIPIITNPDVIFYCGDEQVHMQAGECWIFDSWQWHNVVNSSKQDRVHLVVDTAGSSRFWRMVGELQKNASGPDSLRQNGDIPTLAYTEGLKPEIKTEQYNVAPVMAPGELEAIAAELISDFEANPENDPNIIIEYRDLLTDLAKDWREIWHQNGYRQEGWSQYKALLDNTMQKLRPHPRALVTSSNNVGVNPIIVQRILRAALNIEELPAFK